MFTLNSYQKSFAATLFVLLFTGCNQQEFYEKEFLAGVGIPDDTITIPDNGGTTSGGSTSGGSTTGGNVDGGSTTGGSSTGGTSTAGSTTGSSTGGSSTGGTSTAGSTTGSSTGGSTTGGTSTAGSTTGSSTGGSSTGGSTTGGSSTGGTSTAGSTTGSSTGGSSTGGTSTAGSTTGSSTGGSSTGGSTTGGSTTGGDPQPGVCGSGTLQNASDTFTQNTAQNAKVDILWVVDDSGSMGDEQAALSYNFDVFINDFIQRDIDFQMAITTTDPRSGRSGVMKGDASRLTREAARADADAFKDYFKQAIQVGTRGSGSERGLQTSNDFFDNYRSWTRDDAYLVVVYLSDEQDQSSGAVENYVNGLRSLKTQPGMVKAYSIVTQTIDPRKQWETRGTRYEEASNLTGGEIADIHQDFHTTLSNFGFKILELLDSFPLSGVPVNTDIEISVNGQPITVGWTYDAQARVIKFDRSAIPNEGSIVIAYYQQCVGQ